MPRSEDKLIKRYGYSKVPNSGAMAGLKGDALETICQPDCKLSEKVCKECTSCRMGCSQKQFLVEIKESDNASYSLSKKTIDKITKEAYAQGYEPKLIIRIQDRVVELTLKERLNASNY